MPLSTLDPAAGGKRDAGRCSGRNHGHRDGPDGLGALLRQAIENDVHVIGVSSQAAGHRTLVPQVIEGLRKQGADDIIVICGGVIPPQDYDTMLGFGVAAVYGPGTNILLAAHEVLGIIRNRRQAA